MPEYTKQHFVPASYLRRFSNDDKIIVYDKCEKKIYESNIFDVAQEREFNDLPDKAFGKYIEKRFQKFEDIFSRTMDELLNDINLCISLNMRKKIAFYLTMQFKRSKEAREEIVSIDIKSRQLLINNAIKKQFPDNIHFPTILPSEERKKLLHLNYILDNKSSKEISKLFFNFIFVLGYAKESTLITSDNPLVKQLNAGNNAECIGIDSKGVEFVIPLNEKFILILKERSFYKAEYEKYENQVIDLNSNEVKIYNELQIKQSTRQIFSKSKENINIVADFCKNNPDKILNKNKKFETVYQTIDGRDYLITKQLNQRNDNY